MAARFKQLVSLGVLLLGSATGSISWAAEALTFITLAGMPGAIATSIDATGSAAQFSAPRGIAIDSAGNLYVADSSNHTIRKITAAGVVTTLAGVAGSAGNVSTTPAKLSEPFGLTVDSAGTVYVADTNNNAIRKITATGVVTTLAGGGGMGSTDGSGTAAKFSEPHGVAVDSSGNLFVTDYMNHTIRKVTATGVVTTLAGSAGVEGFTDGQGTAARFKGLQSIVIDSTGVLYVADAGNRSIRKITPSGLVTTLVNGTTTSQFGLPVGLCVDSNGNVYVADSNAHVIYRVTAAGVTSKIAGTAPVAGSADGSTATALFNAPYGLALDSSNNLYISETSNHTIRKIVGTTVTTFAGRAGRTSSVDGTGAAARFEDPYALAADHAGNLYVADSTDHSIRKITAAGVVTTIAGNPGAFGSADGTGTTATFKMPQGIATDSAANIYVADTGNSTIRKITSAGVVSTLAGAAGMRGSLDATGSAARFKNPMGVAVDRAGNVYVIDSEDNTLRKITPAGVVSTLAGSSGLSGLVNGAGNAARFSVPFDLAVDESDNIYVSDHGNNVIRKVTASGVVTTLAGAGTAGSTNGNGATASFKYPSGIAVDSTGNVYLADTDNQLIRKITPAGDVTTAGGTGTVGSTDGVGTAAGFYNPKDIAVDSSGNVYVADRGNHTVRKGSLAASTASVAVGAGWNLLGHGSTAALTFSDGTLFGDPAKVTSIWKWRNTSGKWAFYSPTMTALELSTYTTSQGYEILTSIDGGEGFWVNAKAAYTVSLPSLPAVSIATVQTGLKSGWNLVSVGEVKSASDFTATSVWAWDNARSAWYFHASDLNASGALASYLQTNGYLSFATDNKTLSLGVGLWVKKP